jgi:tight adherence protein B
MSSIVIIRIVVIVLVIISTALFLIYGSPDERRLHQRMKRFTDPASVAAGVGGAEFNLAARSNKTVSVSLDQKIKQFLPNADLMRLRVERAGFHVSLSIVFLAIGAVALLLTWVFSVLLAFPLQLAILSGLALGLLIPTLVISMRGKKRISQFNASLPDAIDLIVRNVRSGLPVAEGINSVAHDLSGPIAEEFKYISDQVKIGVPMEDSLARAVKRVAAPDFAFLSIALAIQKETGGNLTEALSNLSRLLRQRSQMHLKIKALTSEARSSAMIIGALPFLVIGVLVLVNPDYISILIEDETGQVVSGVALTSMMLGYLVMAKMVRFKI